MQTLEISFQSTLSEALQVGDDLYYVSTGAQGSFITATLNNVVKLGEITDINTGTNIVKVLFDNNNVAPPGLNDFIFFIKNRKANTAGLVGYYADVEFKNKSRKKIELFSVGSEIFESSK